MEKLFNIWDIKIVFSKPMSFVSKCRPGWKWIISFYGKVVTIIMYFIVTTYRNKTGNVCCDCVRYYRNDLCWIRVRIVTLNGNKIRWRSYVTYATKLQNDLWLTIVTKIQLYKILVVTVMHMQYTDTEQLGNYVGERSPT